MQRHRTRVATVIRDLSVPGDDGAPLGAGKRALRPCFGKLLLQGVEPSLALNHAIVTRYKDGNDNIDAHSDKTANIRPDSFIWDLSLGATRELVLYDAVTNAQGKKVAGPEQHRLQLADGDLFILGPKSNQVFVHALVKHPLGEAYPERLSVIYRDIQTFKKPKPPLRREEQQALAEAKLQKAGKRKATSDDEEKSTGKREDGKSKSGTAKKSKRAEYTN